MTITSLDIILRSTLPMTFDDSVSGLELLGKVVTKVNELTEAINGYMSTDIVAIVEGVLTGYKDDGTLESLIDAALVAQYEALDATVTGHITDIAKLKNEALTTVYAIDFKTGANDWGQAINDAIASITAGTVILPAGALEYSHAIVQKSNITIRGQGVDATILKPIVCFGITVAINEYLRFARIEDLSINGDNNLDISGYLPTRHGINWNTGNKECYQCTIKNVRVAYCFGKGVYVPYDFNNLYEQVFCSYNGGNAIEIAGLNTCTLRSCYVDYVADGKCGYRVYGKAVLDGCNGMGGNGQYWGVFGRQGGAFEDADGGLAQHYVTLINCNIEDFTITGLRFIYAGGFNLINCHFYAPAAGTFDYYIDADYIFFESIIDGVSGAATSGATLNHAKGFKSGVNNPNIISYGLFDEYTTDGTTVIKLPLIHSGVYDGNLQNAIEIDYMNIRGMTYYKLGGAKHTFGTAAPGSGAWLRGDTVHNTEPSAAGYVGWICTVAGTPGTWKGYGLIQA